MFVDASDPTWHLLDDEKMLWTGRPKTGWMLTGRDVFMIPFGMFFFGFSVFWEVQVFRGPHPPPLLFKLWGIPFILAGLFLLFGRFAVDSYIRSKTRYAVTNQRVLISRLLPFRSLTSLSLERLPELRLVQHLSSKGDIYFGASTPLSNRSFGVWVPSLDSTPSFIGIDDATKLFGMMQEHIRNCSRRST